MECWNIGWKFTLLHASSTPLLEQLKRLRSGVAAPLFLPAQRRGCSSVVEHLLAKEDVASSSLVTRSSLQKFRWIEPRRSGTRC
jgi:hypothetical protein